MSKLATLLLIAVLVLSGLVMVGAVFAQSIPKPSVPEFTVELVDSSYDVPTTYSIDPYTGENLTHAGYRVESRTIEIRIKNEPFTPFSITNGSNTYTVRFYYNIRFKGHFEEEWHKIYNPNVNGLLASYGSYRTEAVLSLEGEYSSTEGLKIPPQGIYFPTFPPNSQIDFQVEAMIGYIHHVDAMPFSADVFEGETSGWSATQTLNIEEIQTPSPEPTSSPEPTPAEEPQQVDQDMTTGAVFAVASIVVFLGLLVYFIKRR